jgi:hypothetical protein
MAAGTAMPMSSTHSIVRAPPSGNQPETREVETAPSRRGLS